MAGGGSATLAPRRRLASVATRALPAAWLLALVGVTACTLLVETDDLDAPARPQAHDGATAPDARTDRSTADAIPGLDGADEGTVDAQSADASRCSTGTAVPVEVISDERGQGLGRACRVSNALGPDGLHAGLDYFGGSPYTYVADTGVTSCMRFDFGDALALDLVHARLGWTSNACGYACIPDVSAGCGTCHDAQIFASASDRSFVRLGHISGGSTDGELVDRSIQVPGGLLVRYVLVCRGICGEGRDDIIVDALWGTCR